ncbi:unnamed protein product, partial [Ectocarpus sp. 12 AP-2014]
MADVYYEGVYDCETVMHIHAKPVYTSVRSPAKRRDPMDLYEVDPPLLRRAGELRREIDPRWSRPSSQPHLSLASQPTLMSSAFLGHISPKEIRRLQGRVL